MANSLRKGTALLNVAVEFVKSVILLQSGILGVVSTCASLHDNIHKLRIGY